MNCGERRHSGTRLQPKGSLLRFWGQTASPTTSCSHSAPLTSAAAGISLLCLQPAGGEGGLGPGPRAAPNISFWVSKKTLPLNDQVWGLGGSDPRIHSKLWSRGKRETQEIAVPPPPSPQLPPHPTPQTRKPNPAR